MSTTGKDAGSFISDLPRITKVTNQHLIEVEGPDGSYAITGDRLYLDISNYINSTTALRGLIDGQQELHEIIAGLRARIEVLESPPV